MSDDTALSPRSAQCLCGAVRFTVQPANAAAGACHCKMCQRWTGSALVTVTAAPDGIALQPDVAENAVHTYTSSPWAERSFCGTCGAGLWYRVTVPGPHQGMHFVPAGLLDDTSGLTFDHEVFYDQRSGLFDYANETTKKTEAEVMAEFEASAAPGG